MTSKDRLLVLDAVRGLSAVTIVVYHASGAVWPVHGYLAVDLFFLLSGYVVAAAYEARLEAGAGLGWFFGVRMARLYPTYLLGILLGVAPLFREFSAAVATKSLLASLAFIPGPTGPDSEVFPMNGALWSLSLEMLINVIYAAGGWRLGTRSMAACVLIAGAVLAAASLRHGDVNMGHNLSLYCGGLARVFFSFPLGVLIYRAHRAGRLPMLKAAPILSVAGLLSLYCFPLPGVAADLTAVMVAFPLLFVTLLWSPPASGRMTRLMQWLGAISYPVYALHRPLQAVSKALALSFIGLTATQTYGQIIIYLTMATVTLTVAWATQRTIEPIGRRAMGWLLGQTPKTAMERPC